MALGQNSSLRTIEICGVGLGGQAGVAFAVALKQNSSLRSFEIRSFTLGDEAGVALAEALGQNSSLRSFKISGCALGDDAGVAFAGALGQNSSLRSFEIRSDALGDEAGVALAEALGQNSSLRSFNISDRALGNDAGVAFAGALKQNSSLRSFEIHSDALGNDAGVALAEALGQNFSLHSFTIYGDALGDDAGVAFAGALGQNSSLRSFEIPWFTRGDESLAALARALERNGALLRFDLLARSWPAARGRLQRNREAAALWASLAALARPHRDGPPALLDARFHRDLVGFLLPAGCPWPFAGSAAFSGGPRLATAGCVASPAGPGAVPGAAGAGAVLSGAEGEGEEALRGRVEQDVKVMLAMETSDAMETEREAADVLQAIQLSKADYLAEAVTLVRLTRQARSAAVMQRLLEAPELEQCRRSVADAGLELRPQWAGGALLLVPLTPAWLFSQLEAHCHGQALRKDHVLIKNGEVEALRVALARVPRESRPKVGRDPAVLTSERGTEADCGSDWGSDRDDDLVDSPASSDEDAAPASSATEPAVASHPSGTAATTAPFTGAAPPADRAPFVIKATFVHVPGSDLGSGPGGPAGPASAPAP